VARRIERTTTFLEDFMSAKLAALSVALAAGMLAACAGHYGSSAANDSSFTLPGMPDLRMTATLPDGSHPSISNAAKGTISEELPTEGLGTIKDTFWNATLGIHSADLLSSARLRARDEAHDQEHLEG